MRAVISVASKPSANGFLLTIDENNASYAIICYNIRTYCSAGVVAVIGGKHQAELEMKKFEDAQNSSHRHEGWRYLIDKTDLKAGTNPAEATMHREAELERRESKALLEPQRPNFLSQHRHR